jgi:hypothetical protein
MDQTQPEVLGLLALMLLLDARRRDGVLVTLPNQDRSAWNFDQLEEGHALVRPRPSGPGSLAVRLRAGSGREVCPLALITPPNPNPTGGPDTRRTHPPECDYRITS